MGKEGTECRVERNEYEQTQMHKEGRRENNVLRHTIKYDSGNR